MHKRVGKGTKGAHRGTRRGIQKSWQGHLKVLVEVLGGVKRDACKH